MARDDKLTATRSATPAEPRYATIWAAVVYAISAMLLAYPALSGQFLINVRSDQYKAGYAFREFGASWLKSGHGFPQWNPYLLGGLPYVAAMHGDIFYPTFLLRMMMSTDHAMTWEFIIHLFLAGLFTFLFLRSWSVSFAGALIGGLAYMLSGPIAGYASPGHDGKLFVSALLPLALLLLVRGMRDGRFWAWGALAITIGLAVLSPHPQLLQYLLLVSGAFALYLAFANAGAGALDRRVAFRRLGLALAAVVVGALIGAIQFLPVREYVAWSPRVGGRGYDFATSFSMPIEELINVIVPQFSGILELYWGRNGIHFHSEYAGAAVIVLATAAAGATLRPNVRSFRRFWTITLVVSVLWALGGSTPFYRLIYVIVPGTRYFRAPSTMMFASMFSTAVLAGLGTERILARRITARFAIAWTGIAVLLAVIGVSGGFTNIAHVIAASFPPELQADDRIAANASSVLFGTLRSTLVVIIAAALCWAIATDRIRSGVAAISLAVLVALDLWSIERLYWIFSPPASVLYASDPAIDFVRSTKEPGRVIALELAAPAQPGDPAFHGDALMSHDVRTLLGYHGNELGRFEQLMSKPAPDAVYPLEPQLNPAIWRHENAQYLYTTLPDSLIPALQSQVHIQGSITKLVGPVRDAAGSMVYLYKLPGDNPAAWLATAMVKASDDQALATVRDARFDPTRAAIVDPDASAVQAVQVQSMPDAPTQRASVGRYEPGAIDVTFDHPTVAGQALLVAENFYPGWRATVDGKPAVVARMDYNLIGVVMPTGGRTASLRFVDAAYERGKVVTILALLVAALGLVAGVVVDRRHRPALQPT
jgi:hypothetical protein